jgi:curli biogenesis system outer membrane secretion channel CsgG
MTRWSPIAAFGLAVMAAPLSFVGAQSNAVSGVPPSGQGPGLWRGPKLRVGVMDLTASAIQGQMGAPVMGAQMAGAPVMQPGVPVTGAVEVPPGTPIVAPGVVPVGTPIQGAPVGTPLPPPPTAVGGIPVVSNAVANGIPAQAQMIQQPQMPSQPQMAQAMPPGSIPPPPSLALGLTEMLTTALTQQTQFVVLERSKVDQVLNEQNFGASGRVDPASAAQAGKVLGAQVLIFGDITEYSEHESSVGGGLNVLKSVTGQVGASVSRVTAQVALDLRLVDANTGQVVSSVRGEGEASATGVAANFETMDQNVGAGGSAQTPLGQASRSAIANAVAGIVEGMQKIPWSGRVVDVRGTQVYINAGATQGIAAGMTFDVYSQGEALVDPETHLSLGAPDTRVGGVTIINVAPQYAVGQITDGTGMKRNDVVRFKGAGNAP